MKNYVMEMMGHAKEAATWSKVQSSVKVGAAAAKNKRLIATGRNGYPPGFPDSVDFFRFTRLLLTTHAEANLIASCETSLIGADLFVTLPPCNDCAKLIITSGISRVFVLYEEQPKRTEWEIRYKISRALFSVCGVRVFHVVNDRVISMPQIDPEEAMELIDKYSEELRDILS